MLGHPDQDSIYTIHTTQEYPLGFEREWEGGLYVYARGGGANVAGMLSQGPATTAGHIKMAIDAAVAAGGRVLRVVQGAAIAIDEYKDGQLIVVTNGATAEFKTDVEGNEAQATGTPQTNARVTLKEPIPAALEAGAIVSLVPNPFDGVVLAGGPPTQLIAGVALRAVGDGSYGWFQVRGHGALRQDGTVVVGEPVFPSGVSNGSVLGLGAADLTYSANEQAMLDALSGQQAVGTVQDGGGADGDLFPALIHIR